MALSIVILGEPLSLRPQRVTAPEMGEFTEYILELGAKTFSFVPVRGWKVGLQPEQQKVVLKHPTEPGGIVITIRPENPALNKRADPASLKSLVQTRFPGGQIVEEYACYTSNHSGRAFVIHWSAPGDVPMISRLAFFAVAGRTLEFDLTAPTRAAEALAPNLGALLTSFQERSPTPAN